jgi:hypothetical protein
MKKMLGVPESATAFLSVVVAMNGPAPAQAGAEASSKNPLDPLYKAMPELLLVASAAKSLVENPVLLASETAIVIAVNVSPASADKEICIALVLALFPFTQMGEAMRLVVVALTDACAEEKEINAPATTKRIKDKILYFVFILL